VAPASPPSAAAPPASAAGGGPPPLLRWRRVYLNLDWSALLHHTLRLSELSIDGPRIDLQREPDGRIDPLAYARPTAEKEPAPKEPTPGGQGKGGGEPAGTRASGTEATGSGGRPWALAVDRLELRQPDLRLDDARTGAELVRFGLQGLRLDGVGFKEDHLVLGGVSIAGPALRVRRDFALGLASGPPSAPKAPPSAAPAPTYRVDRIAIEGAHLTLLTQGGPVDLILGLHAEDVAAKAGETFPIHVTVGTEPGRLSLDGRVGLAPVAFAGTLQWQQLRFPPLLLATQPEIAAWLRSCRSAGKLDLALHLAAGADGSPPGLRISGHSTLEDFDMADPGGSELGVAWKALAVSLRELTVPLPEPGAPVRPIHVSLESVRLDGPVLRYVQPATALDALLGGGGGEPAPPPPTSGTPSPAEPAAPAKAASSSPATPLQLDLDAFALSDAALRFEDHSSGKPFRATADGVKVSLQGLHAGTGGGAPEATLSSVDIGIAGLHVEDHNVEPGFDNGVKDFSLSARDVRWPGPAADQVRLRGVAADGGRFDLAGALRGDTGEARLDLRNLALSPFSPYAARAAGYQLGGDASLETRVRIRSGRYRVDNHIVLHRLDVSSQEPGDFERRFGVPLDLALALLRDPSGNISLSVPLAVDEKGAHAGVGTVVAGALRQALVGALASPLKLVGAAFSAAGSLAGPSLPPITCDAGSATPAPGQDDAIAGWAKLLAGRPALGLRLHGRTGPADRPRLAEQMLIERVQGGKGLPDLAGGPGFLTRRRITGALAARGRGEAGVLDAEDQAWLDRYVQAEDVSSERMVALARKRAEDVRDAIGAQPGVDAARITVSDPAPDGAPGVVVELAAR
jgi:hypothetical protein